MRSLIDLTEALWGYNRSKRLIPREKYREIQLDWGGGVCGRFRTGEIICQSNDLTTCPPFIDRMRKGYCHQSVCWFERRRWWGGKRGEGVGRFQKDSSCLSVATDFAKQYQPADGPTYASSERRSAAGAVDWRIVDVLLRFLKRCQYVFSAMQANQTGKIKNMR